MELLVAFVVAVIATPLVARLATRLGVVDRPGPLKTHRTPVPYLGGIAVALALAAALSWSDRPEILVPIGLALALGIADDVRPINPVVRLSAEVLVGASAALVVPGPLAARVATAVLVVVLLNAVNLLDGQDGLAAGVCAVAAAGFATLGGDAQAAGLALAGALLGFLVFNRPPARIYLGDGGAYVVGTTLAMLPVLSEHGTTSLSVWLATPLLVALPIADTAIAVLRRLRTHRPLFAGDRSHVYDQLVDRGLSVTGSTLVCVAIQVPLTAAGAVAAHLDPWWAAAITAAGTLAVLVIAFGGGFISASTMEETS